MSILFSGALRPYATKEKDKGLSVITKKSLMEKYLSKLCQTYNGIKYHIMLGDAGFLWPGNYKVDRNNFGILSNRPFPILCVAGNHDPILGMKDVPETDIGIGETVYQIHYKPFVAYLKRGKVYTIDGIKTLVLGGALSVNKDKLKPNVTWWKQEYWSEQEKQDVFKLLETENVFDLVISHTGPHRINKLLFDHRVNQIGRSPKKFTDEVAFLNDEICRKIQFREWWCSHWRCDEYYYDPETNQVYQYLYNQTKVIEKKDGVMSLTNEFFFPDR